MPTSWWAGKPPSPNRLEGGLPKCHLPALVPSWLNKLSKVAAISIDVPMVSPRCFLPFQEGLQDQQMGLTQAPFKSLPLCCVSEPWRFCMYPLRVESLFPTALSSRVCKPCWPSKPDVLGFPSWCRIWIGELNVELGPLVFGGEPLQL